MSNISIWLIDRTLLDATIWGQSGLGSNGNEGVLHIPQSSKARASSSDCLNVIFRTLVGGIFSRDAVSVFYSSIQLGCLYVCVYLYVDMFVLGLLCFHVSVCVCVCVNLCVYYYVDIFVLGHLCFHLSVWVCVFVFMFLCVWIYLFV